MTGYLLDTNHVSAVLKNHVHVLARMRAPNQAEYGVSLPAVGELWYMVFNSARVAQTPQTFNASCKTFGCGLLTSQRLLISAESKRSCAAPDALSPT